MKKITLFLFIVLGVSLGHAQLLVDFEGGAYPGTLTYSPEDGDCPGANTGVFSQEANPVPAGNPSATAAEIITDTAGQPWQNAQLFLDAGDEIDLTGTTKTISVLVYSTDPIDILAKVVDGPGGGPTESATSASHTGGSTWQTLNFDFNVNLDGSAVATEVYSRILFFPLWNEGGAGFSGGPYCGTQPLQTIWIDDITNTSTLGVEDYQLIDFSTYPNPTQDSWTIKTKNEKMSSIQVFDVLGKNVLSMKPNLDSATIDGSNLKAGIYFAQVRTAEGSSSIKLIKQ